MSSNKYSKDRKGKFADVCRKSASNLAEGFDKGWKWLELIENDRINVGDVYHNQSRLRAFTIYYLKRLSEQQEDDLFLDPGLHKTVLSIKHTLPEVYDDVDGNVIPPNSIEKND